MKALGLLIAVLIVVGVAIVGVFTAEGPNASTTVAFSSTAASTTTINGSVYSIDNITRDMYAEDPGTFHFYNGSVTFLGVTFQTICTDYSDCPGVQTPPPGATVTVASGAGISLNITFSDQTSESLSGGFPLVPVFFHALTKHANPQAGILIVNTAPNHDYESYLLVSQGPGSGIGDNNFAIAVTGLGVCSSDCLYPSPYAYATVNSSLPISTLTVYVNGTYDGTPISNPAPNNGSGCPVPQNSTKTATTCTVTVTVNSITSYAYVYKGSLPASLVPAVKGDTYVFKFVATFQDGLSATAIAETVAD